MRSQTTEQIDVISAGRVVDQPEGGMPELAETQVGAQPEAGMPVETQADDDELCMKNRSEGSDDEESE